MKLLAAVTDQLAAAIEGKEGTPKALSLRALTDLLTRARREVPEKLRAGLAASLTDLPWMQQSEVLEYRWDAVKTAAMLPSLRRIVDHPPEGRRELRDLAARRIYELDPAEGRKLILEDMLRKQPLFGFQVLAALPDQTLPSIESSLMDNLERTGDWIGRELIARYGSKAILPRVKALSARAPSACDPTLNAYFLRVDPEFGEAKIRQAQTEAAGSRCQALIISQTARYYAGPEWEKIAIEALQDPLVGVKMDAARALGQRGSSAAKEPLFRAFEYWRDWWKNRPAEMNEENRYFERELARALATGKAWKLQKAEFSRLEALCLTEQCRRLVVGRPAEAAR